MPGGRLGRYGAGLAALADLAGVRVMLPDWLVGSMAASTLAVAGLSGLAALPLLRKVDPVVLLR